MANCSKPFHLVTLTVTKLWGPDHTEEGQILTSTFPVNKQSELVTLGQEFLKLVLSLGVLEGCKIRVRMDMVCENCKHPVIKDPVGGLIDYDELMEKEQEGLTMAATVIMSQLLAAIIETRVLVASFSQSSQPLLPGTCFSKN